MLSVIRKNGTFVLGESDGDAVIEFCPAAIEQNGIEIETK